MPGSLQAHRRNLPLHHSKKARYILSCKATDGRRDVLLHLLGGAAAAGLSKHHSALAAPIQSPDLSNCHPIDLPNVPPGTNCCLPSGITDFKLPPPNSPLRVRPAAHLVKAEYVARYEMAVQRMKELPPDDPRSFSQQWRIHCAYCDGAYDQVGVTSCLPIQIHLCWLFFPWHRLYLYFHERILGKLIDDDTFALPYWNWDAPSGMTLPQMYDREFSPLYSERRNPDHKPPSMLDLSYCGTDHIIPEDVLIDQNLKIMYRQMISCPKKTQLFLGRPYRAGDKPCPGGGSIELVPHNTVHNWTGTRQPHYEDMGNLYSAARDPVFFAHHGNIDRMWHIWRGLCPSNTNFTDADWLDANFLFYDEEARLVRVRVRDCLDASALCYTYQDAPLPWLNAKPDKVVAGTPAKETGTLPATLKKTVRVKVRRPKVSRSREEKDEQEEVLIIEGIADRSKYVKFDVYVNEPEGGGVTAAAAQCAGCVALTPHIRPVKDECTVNTWFGMSDLLDTIGADGDETIIVSLVPRAAGEFVTVRSVSIGYVK